MLIDIIDPQNPYRQQYDNIHSELQQCRIIISEANSSLNSIKLGARIQKQQEEVKQDDSKLPIRSIFDSTTEEEDDKVSTIIAKIKEMKKNNDEVVEREIKKGKREIDKQLKKKLKQKYLK